MMKYTCMFSLVITLLTLQETAARKNLRDGKTALRGQRNRRREAEGSTNNNSQPNIFDRQRSLEPFNDGYFPEASTRIVGGDSSDVGQFPYFVDMLESGCGGTLIAPRVVLTAAHCDKDNDKFKGEKVLVGAFENDEADHGAFKVKVDDQAQHPDYGDGHNNAYDFTLVLLGEEAQIDQPRATIIDNDVDFTSISSGALEQYPKAGTDLRVIGLGRLESGGESPGFLRDVVVPVVDIDDCEDLYDDAGKDIEKDNMFCAGTFICHSSV